MHETKLHEIRTQTGLVQFNFIEFKSGVLLFKHKEASLAPCPVFRVISERMRGNLHSEIFRRKYTEIEYSEIRLAFRTV